MSIQHIQLIYDILCIIYIILIRIANDIYENKEDKTNDTFTMSIGWKYQDINNLAKLRLKLTKVGNIS